MVYRAGLAAEASVETSANRVTRRRAIRNGRRALDDLFTDLDGLFRFIAQRYAHTPDDFADLLQVARIHALHNLPRWQPGRGSTVASWVTRFLPKELSTARRRLHPDYEVVSAFDSTFDDRPVAEPAVIDHRFGEIDSLADVVRAVDNHRSHLERSDVVALDEVLRGHPDATGSAPGRQRVRALFTHPTSGVMASLAADDPTPRPPTAPDIDADARWLADNGPQPEWQLFGACREDDQRFYFPERGVAYRPETLTRCASCPVRLDCLAAGCVESLWPGLWGGHSFKHRVTIRRRVQTHLSSRAEIQP